MVPIRLPVSRLKMIEAIKAERGHKWRNDTLKEAVNEYIDRYLREERKAS